MENVREKLQGMKARSAWSKGVKVYAEGLLDDLDMLIYSEQLQPDDLKSRARVHDALLNGATDWKQYSWGGCALIYDQQIARLLCTPTELKITRNGQRRPNKREEWLDVQARALYQAERLVMEALGL